jgi:hypothetical protein
MQVKRIFFIALLFVGYCCHAQHKKDSVLIDTTFLDYDEIFSELDALLDSLNTPRSFSLVDVTVGNNYFNYTTKSGTTETKRQFTYSPSLGYFDKSGLGISAGASIVNDGVSFSPFQYSVTGSYDYLKTKSLMTGLSLTHFFTKADLPFYTSPLQNELYGYFTLRKLWFKPSVAASYGWGSREAYEEREESIESLLLAKRGYTRINTTEKIIDMNLIASVRHDFYFLDALAKHDFIRITPQLSFTSGTQQFGFNQTSTTYASRRITGRNILYNSKEVTLDNNLYFQPLSLTGYLKAEYAKGKFFVQPQLIFDYYFPATTNQYTTSFLINAGFVF